MEEYSGSFYNGNNAEKEISLPHEGNCDVVVNETATENKCLRIS